MDTAIYPPASVIRIGFSAPVDPELNETRNDTILIPSIFLIWPGEIIEEMAAVFKYLAATREETAVWILHDPPFVEKGAGWVDIAITINAIRESVIHIIRGEAEFEESYLKNEFMPAVAARGSYVVVIGKEEEDGKTIGFSDIWSMELSKITDMPSGSNPPKDFFVPEVLRKK